MIKKNRSLKVLSLMKSLERLKIAL